MSLVLGLEHSCPWPRECLSSERLSLALDFFCVLGLGLEPCVLDSTSVKENNAEGSNKKNVAAGEYIIVEYKAQQFPGKLTSVESEGAVSTLTKCKRNGWRCPQTKDEILYEWDNIVKARPQAIPLNNRNILRFPVLEDMWGM